MPLLRPHRSSKRLASLAWALGCLPGAMHAAEPALRCQAIADAAQRLACYDARFPVEAPGASRTLPSAAPGLEAIARESDEAQARAESGRPASTTPSPPSQASAEADDDASPLARFWEIGPANRRETFVVKTYEPSYLLPLHRTTHINRQPHSPTRGVANDNPNYQALEAKYQISLRAKLAQDVLVRDASVWLAYTQRSMWQVWNPKDSAPFRSTDYQPEALYLIPIPRDWGQLPGHWRWRQIKVGAVHQSNGQSDPLSRSWNRSYVETAFEHGDVAVEFRVNKRLFKEGASNDDNPDITHYMGEGETRISWLPGRATASLLWRTGLKSWQTRAVMLDWTYPVNKDKPGGLRWYLQFFSGYGETLIDYNHRQNSFGLGFSVFQF